jgi:hypothetical protein
MCGAAALLRKEDIKPYLIIYDLPGDAATFSSRLRSRLHLKLISNRHICWDFVEKRRGGNERHRLGVVGGYKRMSKYM